MLLSPGHGKLFQGNAHGPLPAIDSGAGFVLVKFSLGTGFIAINLPAAAAFAGPVIQKALNVLRGIAQEQADFVRELFRCPDPLYELGQTLAVTAIAMVLEDLDSCRILQIFF